MHNIVIISHISVTRQATIIIMSHPTKSRLVTTTTILMLNYFFFLNAHVTENTFDWLL